MTAAGPENDPPAGHRSCGPRFSVLGPASRQGPHWHFCFPGSMRPTGRVRVHSLGPHRGGAGPNPLPARDRHWHYSPHQGSGQGGECNRAPMPGVALEVATPAQGWEGGVGVCGIGATGVKRAGRRGSNQATAGRRCHFRHPQNHRLLTGSPGGAGARGTAAIADGAEGRGRAVPPPVLPGPLTPASSWQATFPTAGRIGIPGVIWPFPATGMQRGFRDVLTDLPCMLPPGKTPCR